MTFSEYDVVKAQYTVTEQFEQLRLYLCADRDCTDHVWQAPLGVREEPKASNSFYVLMIPKGLDFTEERYEILKSLFEKYVKNEKVKEKLAKINKDFV